MKNPFKSREPMTPAQKKIVAGVACIVLIVVASLAFDFLLARRDAQPETDSVTVAQTAVQDDSEQDAEAAEAEATQPSDDEESQATPYSEIGIGESYDAGDIALVNDSEYVIGEEGGALIGDLRAFLIASGIDYDGAEFTVVAFVSSNDTGSASFFMTSDLSGAQYLQATRASSDSGFQISTAADEAAFNALMDQALAGYDNSGTSADAASETSDAASADASTSGAEQNG